MENQSQKISIIIPAFNEEKNIDQVLSRLKNYLKNKSFLWEIIVVNDGSSDQTKEIVEKIENIKLINHPYNKGYGASIKTGAKNAQYDWILLFDGDEQHNPEDIDKLIANTDNYQMIVGARTGYQGPAWRQPGKKILRLVANFLAEHKIPDLNCGLRLIKKEDFFKFVNILPNGFSLSTTITIAFFKEGLNVKYVPIFINKRIGRSSVKIKDGILTFMLILRIIMLFSPLKIFLPFSVLIFGLSFASFILDVFYFTPDQLNISDTTILFSLAALLFFFFGLLADQISAIRRELNK